MAVFLLVLLVLAAAAGVLGAVLKFTLVLVLSLVLSIVLLAWIGAWYAKRRMRAFQRDFQVGSTSPGAGARRTTSATNRLPAVLPPGSSETAGSAGRDLPVGDRP